MPKDERNERNSQNATGESLANCVEPSHFIPFWVQDSDPICKSALNAVAGLGETPEEGVTKREGPGRRMPGSICVRVANCRLQMEHINYIPFDDICVLLLFI